MHDMNDIDINHINCHVSTKFYRRKDLTVETRLYIAFMALLCNKWGLITQMAKQYAISRTFIYMLQSQLNTAVEDYFYAVSAPSKKELTIMGKEKSLEYTLLLRLEGKCSIPSISEELPSNSYYPIGIPLFKYCFRFEMFLSLLTFFAISETMVNIDDTRRWIITLIHLRFLPE